MKAHTRLALILAVVLASVLANTPVRAQTQAGDIEIYGLVASRSGDAGQLESHPNLHFDIDHIWIYGGGAAYYLTDGFSFVADLAWGNSNLKLSESHLPGAPSYTQTARYFDGRLNFELTPFAARFSPFLTGGLGFSDFETALPGALPQVYCTPGAVYWWCGTGVPSFSETAVTYNIGAGARFDITPALFVKLMYTSTWADYGGLGTRRDDEVTLQIGGRVRSHH